MLARRKVRTIKIRPIGGSIIGFAISSQLFVLCSFSTIFFNIWYILFAKNAYTDISSFASRYGDPSKVSLWGVNTDRRSICMRTVKTSNSRHLFQPVRVPMIRAAFVVFMVLVAVDGVHAQTSEFTYQGSLSTSGMPANGSYDFEFRLFDTLAVGVQQGPTVARNGVSVSNGIFAVSLDFGNQFPGASRFLEIRTRVAGGGAFTPLLPRQPINGTPYAVRSLSSGTAGNATQLGGIAADQYVVTTDTRMTNARAPTAGSSNYIQNQSAGPQASSNFNVSGTGTANIIAATTQYNIGPDRVLSTAGSSNLFAGVGAGTSNTGSSNSFYGNQAGNDNTTGVANSFFGGSAGSLNVNGSRNSFFGRSAGADNAEGSDNSFFGYESGNKNSSGTKNSFFGYFSGTGNTEGASNSFVGQFSGQSNTTGDRNAFFGSFSGASNTTGSDNTIIGSGANVGSGNLSFATAIGADSVASLSSSIYLGRSSGADTVRIPGAVIIEGSLVVDTLGGTTGNVHLCRNTSNRLSLCSPPLTENDETEALKERLNDQQEEISGLRSVASRLRSRHSKDAFNDSKRR